MNAERTLIPAVAATTSRLRRGLVWGGTAAALVVITGCADLHAKRMKQEAQARWDGMRAKVKVRLASDRFEQGQVDDALAQLGEAARLGEGPPGAATLLAKIQLAKGQLTAARATLDEAAAGRNRTAEISYLQAVLEERAGRPHEAFETYRAAFEAEPDNPDYFAAVCESMLALGMARQTVAWLNVQEETHGHTAMFHVLMGRALRLAGRYVEAAAAYESAMELGRADDAIKEARALCLMWGERYGEAGVLLRSLLAGEPVESRPVLQLALCRCLLESGAVAPARERLARLARATTPSVLLWQLMARAAWVDGDGGAALRHARKAASLEEADHDAHLMVALFAYRLGHDDLARDALRIVLRTEPTNPLAVRLRRELNRRQSAQEQRPAEVRPPGHSEYRGAVREAVRSLLRQVVRTLQKGGALMVMVGADEGVTGTAFRRARVAQCQEERSP